MPFVLYWLVFYIGSIFINVPDIFSSCIDERPKKFYDTRFDILSAVLWDNSVLKGMNKLCSIIICNQISK